MENRIPPMMILSERISRRQHSRISIFYDPNAHAISVEWGDRRPGHGHKNLRIFLGQDGQGIDLPVDESGAVYVPDVLDPELRKLVPERVASDWTN